MRALPAADECRTLEGAAGRGRKVTLDGWTRNGYALDAGAAWTLSLNVEAGMRLELAFALVVADPAAPPPPTRFDVVVASDGEEKYAAPLLTVNLGADSSGRWIPRLLDLAPLAGR